MSSANRRETGVVLGLNYSRYLFGEVGYFRSSVYEMGGFEMNSTTLSAGSEFSYVDRLLVAPKVQARVQLFFLQASLAPILYTDFKQASLKLRPEIGLGLYNGGLSYGYNAGIVNNSFHGINKHVFTARYFLTRKRKTLHEYDQKGRKMR
ncbi:hypothetical protein [Hymenobacter guriensis]|uniref:Outer membrane protein beta-barrel domain-containing protein n=1 Tax=Hymenobacter guriensis TaxID=2793065 RepID=A0ABS0L7Q1_9BACT|nr:hypothetical protein [Hymenobacter guriensis]MBG8555553.1 hypothetical protein [Hymenobacter guriensis]